MLQRIRNCSAFENKSILFNEVEIDETYIGGKNKNRHANKKVERNYFLPTIPIFSIFAA